MKKIGITGIIGSGKSKIAKIFETIDIPVYYADAEAKILINNSEDIKNALKNRYGSNIYINNVLNKSKLSEIIFNFPEERFFVNNIVHPVVISDFISWSKKTKSSFTVIESALIYESGLDKYLDKIINVKSPEKLRLERIMKRDNIPLQEAKKKINSQQNDERFDNISDYIIINDEKNSLILQILPILKDLFEE